MSLLVNMASEDEKELVGRAGSVKGLTVTLDTARRLDLMVDYGVCGGGGT